MGSSVPSIPWSIPTRLATAWKHSSHVVSISNRAKDATTFCMIITLLKQKSYSRNLSTPMKGPVIICWMLLIRERSHVKNTFWSVVTWYAKNFKMRMTTSTKTKAIEVLWGWIQASGTASKEGVLKAQASTHLYRNKYGIKKSNKSFRSLER